MNKKHLNIDELTRYFLNDLSRDSETSVQEHLSSCAECGEKLDNMRLLRKSVFETDISVASPKYTFKVLSSTWVKFAAAAVMILGMGIGYFRSSDNGLSTVNEGIAPEIVLCVDSLSKEDSIDYYSSEEKADSTETACTDSLICD